MTHADKSTFFEAFWPAMFKCCVVGACLMALQRHFMARGGEGSAYNLLFHGLGLVIVLPLVVLVEVGLPFTRASDPGGVLAAAVGLPASVLSYLAAWGVLNLMGSGLLQHSNLLQAQMLLLLPALALVLVLVHGFCLSLYLLRAGGTWADVWRQAVWIKLSTFSAMALVFIVFGSYSFLAVPHVAPGTIGLPPDQVLYYRRCRGWAHAAAQSGPAAGSAAGTLRTRSSAVVP